MTADFDFPGCIIHHNKSLANYTSFGIGGIADTIVYPLSADAFISAVNFTRTSGSPYIVLGGASNVLISDKPYHGVVFITHALKEISVNETVVRAKCGVFLSRIATFARDNSLTGAEFLYGIPGTAGGGIYMNAGAYGGEISGILTDTLYYDVSANTLRTIPNEAHEFAHRESVFQRNDDYIILSSTFNLKHGDKDEITRTMNSFMSSRKIKQPLEYKSAGSTFKRAPGYYTAKLIDDCGLKGYSVGGAQVSQKHAGFIINKGGAVFDDVIRVIEHVKSEVLRQTGVAIECEVRIINA
ncbi:UDP-N-acetylenolpyruvoylglucosamine reductase [Clostridia bacterium]|nr:UDP-N-acetylenolpyruvoylglucosamine reductase [Clostridia bacterium]